MVNRHHSNYRQQHLSFVQHANTTIQTLEQQKIAMEEEIAKAEAAILQRSQQQQQGRNKICLEFWLEKSLEFSLKYLY